MKGHHLKHLDPKCFRSQHPNETFEMGIQQPHMSRQRKRWQPCKRAALQQPARLKKVFESLSPAKANMQVWNCALKSVRQFTCHHLSACRNFGVKWNYFHLFTRESLLVDLEGMHFTKIGCPSLQPTHTITMAAFAPCKLYFLKFGRKCCSWAMRQTVVESVNHLI